MFAVPRPKKAVLPPPSKKRKVTSAVEEVNFDNNARHEYLTGFHKRKQQRIKHAQDEAAKKARQEKLDNRRQVREERKREAETHVQNVNKMLRDAGLMENATNFAEGEDGEKGTEEWDGFPDAPDLEIIDHEEEYIDEDRYTTVTVESVAVTRDGFEKPPIIGEEDENSEPEEGSRGEAQKAEDKTNPWGPKKKKKKFRYETKIERKLTEAKRKIKARK